MIIEAYGFKPLNGYAARGIGYQKEIAPTLNGEQTWGRVLAIRQENEHIHPEPGGFNGQDAFSDMLITENGGDAMTSVVRRLTPLECERLQGMPDNWSKYGVNEKGEVYELPDSARYRLQGNGIATPFWKFLLKRISAQYERTPTLGSLFDGQASFPMIWESINGKGTALWSSEIEKHAVAVAKYHFPDDSIAETLSQN